SLFRQPSLPGTTFSQAMFNESTCSLKMPCTRCARHRNAARGVTNTNRRLAKIVAEAPATREKKLLGCAEFNGHTVRAPRRPLSSNATERRALTGDVWETKLGCYWRSMLACSI